MGFVEGIGDEVVIFFAIILLIVTLTVTWISTAVDETSVGRQRLNNNNLNFNNTVSSSSSLSSSDPTERSEPDSENPAPNETDNEEANRSENETESAQQTETSITNSAADSESLEETERTSETNEGEASGIRQRHTDDHPSSAETTEPNSDGSRQEGEIKIRIKYLNDTQNLVNAYLSEKLGDFKSREFSQAVAENKRIRLIFNGQLLKRDQLSLQALGLFDNCVVHCHISSNMTNTTNTNISDGLNLQQELDLGHLMIPLFGFMLATAWYFRIQFRQFFNPISTFALIAVTFLFMASIFAVYHPVQLPSTDRVQRQLSSRLNQ